MMCASKRMPSEQYYRANTLRRDERFSGFSDSNSQKIQKKSNQWYVSLSLFLSHSLSLKNLSKISNIAKYSIISIIITKTHTSSTTVKKIRQSNDDVLARGTSFSSRVRHGSHQQCGVRTGSPVFRWYCACC